MIDVPIAQIVSSIATIIDVMVCSNLITCLIYTSFLLIVFVIINFKIINVINEKAIGTKLSQFPSVLLKYFQGTISCLKSPIETNNRTLSVTFYLHLHSG